MHVNVVDMKLKKKVDFQKSTVEKPHSIAKVFVGLYCVKGISLPDKNFPCDKMKLYYIYLYWDKISNVTVSLLYCKSI